MKENGNRLLDKLENKIAVVTGGAMGNGLGIVETFCKYKAKVAILDYSDELKATVNKLASLGYEVSGYKVDIRDKEKVDICIKKIYDKYGRIDILVNNAGICCLELFTKMSDEMRDDHFDINIKGTWNVTKSVLPHMINNNKGSIINLSSVTGPMVADSGEVAYATTKSALIGFTKSLAIEYAAHNIRVNAILPGYILTPMVQKMATSTNPLNPSLVISSIEKNIPMKRMGTIKEIGELSAFLASDESSYITGSEFVIDGGSTLPETNSMGV